MTNRDKELTFEDIISQAVGAPKELVHKAINKMKNMPEVKQIIDREQCQED